MEEIKHTVFDPLLSHLPKYKKTVFEKALIDSRTVGKPTEELYNQILVIGKHSIDNFLFSRPAYRRHIDDMLSTIYEVSVDVALRLVEDTTIEYPVAYTRKAFDAKLFDLPETLRIFGEHRRTRTRRLVDDIPMIQQQPLKDQMILHKTDTELWEVLEKIAENDSELEIMRLRAQNMTEVEIGQQLGISQPSVARILAKLFTRYQQYMRGI